MKKAILKKALCAAMLIISATLAAASQTMSDGTLYSVASVERFEGELFGGRKDIQRMSPAEYNIHPDRPIVAIDTMPGLNAQANELHRLIDERRGFKRKSTTCGILGGVSIGIGAFMLTTGIVALCENHNGNPLVSVLGVAFTATGGIFTLGSVPLFIACYKNGMRAAKITGKIDMIKTRKSAPTPAIGLSLNF